MAVFHAAASREERGGVQGKDHLAGIVRIARIQEDLVRDFQRVSYRPDRGLGASDLGPHRFPEQREEMGVGLRAPDPLEGSGPREASESG